MKISLRTYLEFFVSRLFGTCVDMLVLWICSDYIFDSYWGQYVLSPVISFEFAVLSNFAASYFWIWRKRMQGKNKKDFALRFLLFNVSSCMGFGIKMAFLLLFERLFGWDVLVCNITALLISGLFNYFCADMVVFRPNMLGKKKK